MKMHKKPKTERKSNDFPSPNHPLLTANRHENREISAIRLPNGPKPPNRQTIIGPLNNQLKFILEERFIKGRNKFEYMLSKNSPVKLLVW